MERARSRDAQESHSSIERCSQPMRAQHRGSEQGRPVPNLSTPSLQWLASAPHWQKPTRSQAGPPAQAASRMEKWVVEQERQKEGISTHREEKASLGNTREARRSQDCFCSRKKPKWLGRKRKSLVECALEVELPKMKEEIYFFPSTLCLFFQHKCGTPWEGQV